MANENLDLGYLFKWEKMALFAVIEVYLEQPELFDDEAKISIESVIDCIRGQLGKCVIRDSTEAHQQWE